MSLILLEPWRRHSTHSLFQVQIGPGVARSIGGGKSLRHFYVLKMGAGLRTKALVCRGSGRPNRFVVDGFEVGALQ
jgi:tRNA 2-selenouridine synthase SelU